MFVNALLANNLFFCLLFCNTTCCSSLTILPATFDMAENENTILYSNRYMFTFYIKQNKIKPEIGFFSSLYLMFGGKIQLYISCFFYSSFFFNLATLFQHINRQHQHQHQKRNGRQTNGATSNSNIVPLTAATPVNWKPVALKYCCCLIYETHLMQRQGKLSCKTHK